MNQMTTKEQIIPGMFLYDSVYDEYIIILESSNNIGDIKYYDTAFDSFHTFHYSTILGAINSSTWEIIDDGR